MTSHTAQLHALPVALLLFSVAACSAGEGTGANPPATVAGNGNSGGAAGSAGAAPQGNAGSPVNGGSGGSVSGAGGMPGSGGDGVSGSENVAGMSQGGMNGGAAGGGAAGEGAAGAAGAEVARPSAGCGVEPDIDPGEYIQGEVGGRAVWVRLPDNYDPNRAYPLVHVWKGCGGAGALSILHLESVAGADAILVHGDVGAGMDCYDTADGAQFVDLPFFDTFHAYLTSKYCVDEAHVFSAGYSSGAWLTQFLACQRGDVLRAIGTIAGGFKPSFFLGATECVGPVAAFMISDLTDTNNPFFDNDNDGDSVEVSVNQWLGAAGCTDTAWSETNGTPAEPDMAVCRDYAGCGENPVKLCLSTGKGHSDQTDISVPGFWAFFSQFLPR